ncbi:MAG: hypothetical protein P0116_17175 [Candidatus Nitrosocosmicus sp.]|nr:hypothetical protein [Candidatus Nitrosocosmicus sp.]
MGKQNTYIWLWLVIELENGQIFTQYVTQKVIKFLVDRNISDLFKVYGKYPVSTDG